MKTLIATLIATAAGASFAAAPTAALNHDAATYNNVKQKADAAYQAAAAKCKGTSGNDKNVCMAEANLARTRAETDALSQYYHTPAGRLHTRTVVANAEYDVAKAKCDAQSGAEKDDCLNNAKSVHTAALADAKSGTATSAAAGTGAGAAVSTGASAGGSLASGADTRDPAKSAAVDKCAQAGGDAKTGCVIETKPSAVRDSAADAASTAASKTRDAAATATEKTKAVAATAAEKSKEVAQTAVEKTKQAASTVADKTESAVDRAGDNTRQAAATAADKSSAAGATAAAKTRVAAADTAITAKVKAGLVKETKLDSLGIHVETVQGVVLLSGFVNNKDEAEKAVQVAKNVDGVNNVRSAIQVK